MDISNLITLRSGGMFACTVVTILCLVEAKILLQARLNANNLPFAAEHPEHRNHRYFIAHAANDSTRRHQRSFRSVRKQQAGSCDIRQRCLRVATENFMGTKRTQKLV